MSESSEIVQFFIGKRVLLTGGTGFGGKLVLERFLRVCHVCLVYMLMRQKKGVLEDDRLEQLFSLPIFKGLQEVSPNFKQRVKIISGNCAGKNLGISDVNWSKLHQEVEIVIHRAAIVRFDQDLRTAFNINIGAVKDLMENAKKMKHLQSYIHVSTAYSNCSETTIKERVYAPPLTAEQLEAFLQTFPDDTFIKQVEKAVLGNMPNTYTYTKCIAEELVQRFAKNPIRPLPVAIVRPSIILSTYKEPFPGWIDNWYGPLTLTCSYMTGLLRTMHCMPSNKTDMVPVDYVVNAILAVAYDTARKGRSKDTHANFEVFNYTSCENSITWGLYNGLMEVEFENVRPMKTFWKPLIYFNAFLFMHNICWFLLHVIPAYLVDGASLLLGKEPWLVPLYKKLYDHIDMMSFFVIREWQMPHRNILSLFDRLNETDQKLFELRISTFDWTIFMRDYLRGGRIYLLKEPISNLEAARKRYRWILAAYYASYGIALTIGCCVMNWILSFLELSLF